MGGEWVERHSVPARSRSLFLPWMLQIMARLLGRFLLENSEAECVGEQLGAFLLIEVETVRISLWM